VNGRRTLTHAARRVRKALAPWFGGRRMANISTANVRAYVNARQADEAANATINRELAALKRMFTLATQAGKLLQRPHIPMLQEHNVRRGFYEREQSDAVRRHLPAPLAAIATFAYLTGWRTKSEILPLQWHQVDLATGVVRLNPGTTKNRDSRVFLFGAIDELKRMLEGQWAQHLKLKARGEVCPWVFRRDGAPIKSYRHAWQTACARAGCPGRILHDFRRTAVRNLGRASVPDVVAMRMTGHKTRSVFDRYGIVSEDELLGAARKLNRLATGTVSGTVSHANGAGRRGPRECPPPPA
jgi:integrase